MGKKAPRSFLLNLVRRVTSGESALEENVDDGSVVYLADLIAGFQEQPEEALSICEVDMSFSTLYDRDMDDVVELVRLFPRCSIVNLSGLFLYETSAEKIQSLTQLSCVRYVVITSTPLASTACWTSYHSVFTVDDLRKIVFISTPAWLARGYWRSTVRNTEKQAIAVNTHSHFYKECPDIAQTLAERSSLVLGGGCDCDSDTSSIIDVTGDYGALGNIFSDFSL